jgi:hypothetical protein
MSDQDRSELDAQFADIVAHWDEDGAEPTPWPATLAEDRVENPAADPASATADPASASTAGQDVPAAATPPEEKPDPLPAPEPPLVLPEEVLPEQVLPELVLPEQWRVHTPPEEPEEHFQPPPPEPLPAGDLQFWGILIGLTGGPLLLLYIILFDRYASGLLLLLAISLTVGGFGLLVARLPRQRDDDDDDGARL